MSERAFTEADLRYIEGNYFTLEELCAGRAEEPDRVRQLIAERRLPAASYVLDDGREMFPADYFLLPDQAGGVERLRRHFAARHRAAGGKLAGLDEDWNGYLSGLYGVCLRHVSPEMMVTKTELVEALNTLLEQPRPDTEAWCARLRRAVWQLDQLEREFSPDYDRGARFAEPPSRDRLIAAARAGYPDAFAVEASVR